MPPLLYLVRHAEGEHNVNDAHHIRDATLTAAGKAQCAKLQATFPLHNVIDLVLSSPLRRAIQTTALSFGPTLARQEIQFVLVPNAQEVSSKTCDIGFPSEILQAEVPKLVEGEEILFDIKKIDYSLVAEGWNSKLGFWAPHREEVQKRAAALRAWLYNLTAKHVLLVSHGAFLHYLTEDWTGDDPKRGTAYLNCEVRQFTFTPGSNGDEAHIMETEKGKKLRQSDALEGDSTILAELETVK